MPTTPTGNVSQALKTTLNNAAALGALVVDNQSRNLLNKLTPNHAQLTPITGYVPPNLANSLNSKQWFLSSDSGFQFVFTDVPNAVNYFNVKHNSTSLPPMLSAEGTDTNIDINIVPKGLGKVTIPSGGLAVNGDLSLNGVNIDVSGFISAPLVDGGGY